MKAKTRQTGAFIVVVIAGILITTTLFLAAAPVNAALPPRTPPAAPTTIPGVPGVPGVRTVYTPGGGYIELHISSAQPEAWTIVQWLDDNGVWHDVDGWRGMSKAGAIKWWVDLGDFNKGPFRWITFESKNGKHLSDSSSFYLPDATGQTIVVTISIR